ncbi:MAG: prepilin peptidase [Bacillota bacterium]|nr:prepilin peptidase [Bacillota bacterium]
MSILENVYVIVLGLILGSFFNVCIYRIPKGESIINPPSHCPKCGQRLKTADLVPVFSWLFLRGRCRYCKEHIPIRYTLVEILTCAVYFVMFSKFGLSAEGISSIFLMSVLICVFFIDIDHRIIPDSLVLTGIAGGIILFVYNIYKPVEFYSDRAWYNPLLGVLAGAGFLFLVALLGYLIYKTDDAMGMGDVKIFIPIGLFLGWRLTLIALFSAIILGALAGILLMILRLKDRKGTIPLGPFIVTGVFIALLWGHEIINWYSKFFNI